MPRPVEVSLYRFTWLTLALLLGFGALQAFSVANLPVIVALRSFADLYPRLASETGSVEPGDIQVTERLLDHAVAEAPENGTAWRARGWLHWLQGDEEEALAAWSHAQGAADELVYLGDREFRSGEAQASVPYYAAATALQPDSADFWNRLGQAYVAVPDWQRAANAFRRGAAIEPSNRLYWVRLAEALAELGDLEGAVEAYTQALDASYSGIGSSEIYFDLGLIYGENTAQTGQTMALDYFDRALEADDFAGKVWLRADAYFQRGSIYAEQDRSEAAILDFRSALQSHPQHYRALLALGSSLWRIGSQEDAIRALTQAVNLRPDQTSARERLGDFLAQTGDIPGAVAQYEEILRLDPDNGSAQDKLSRLRAPQSAP